LISVNVRYWRATKRLTAEDLGLDPGNVESRLISLGHKKLVPKEALARFALIEGRAHSLVEASTFPFLNGLAHFLPNRKLDEVTRRLSAMETEFAEEKARFLEGYEQLRAEAIEEWWALARKLVENPEKLVGAVEESFPCVERMARAFGFSVQLFQVTVPEGLGVSPVSLRDQAEVMRARQEAARQAAEKIRQGAEDFVSDCVRSLREETAHLCEEMLASMKDGKTGVHQKTLNRLVKFIDDFKGLNFVGDTQMEEQLERVKREFLGRSAEDYRSSESSRQRLQDGLRSLADRARQMAADGSRELVERFGQMGVRRFHGAAADGAQEQEDEAQTRVA
jgi:hypothetical protein